MTDTYSYDSHDKLTAISRGGSNIKTYGYDNNGNCASVTVVSGNLTTSLSYDYENRITQITYPNSSTNTFQYNGLSLRTQKVDSAGTFNYVCDGTDPASAVLKDSAAVYTPGLSERRSSTSKFLHPDALGTTRGITNSSQSATDGLLFDAFGMSVSRTGTTPTPFGFVGAAQYQTDADSGLMLLGYRYYDCSIGRFITQDPARDGDNWFTYCDNDPLGDADPEGLMPGQKGGKTNVKLDPAQVEELNRKLKELKDKGSLPDDRKEIKEIERKLKTHEKGTKVRRTHFTEPTKPDANGDENGNQGQGGNQGGGNRGGGGRPEPPARSLGGRILGGISNLIGSIGRGLGNLIEAPFVVIGDPYRMTIPGYDPNDPRRF